MSGEGPSPYAPRHLAHHGRRARHLTAPGQIGAAAHLKPLAALALEAEEASEAPALARVRKGRAAIALAVSLAALPVLVLDNLPATAETSDQHSSAASEVATPDSGSPRWDVPTTDAPTTTVAPTTTLAPTTTTEAPPTTEAEVQAAAVAPPTTSAPPTTQPPPPPPGDPNDPATWERLAECETGSNWSMNSGNGYYGGLQFTLASWGEVGGTGYPHEASKAEQINRGKILQARAGWDQWPACSRELGYR